MNNVNLNDILNDLMEGREEEANAKIHNWFVGIGRDLVREAEEKLAETVEVNEASEDAVEDADEPVVEETTEEVSEEIAESVNDIEIIENKDGSVLLVNHKVKMEVFFQPGDDANSFMEDYFSAVESEIPNPLGHVWDMYSTVAQPINEAEEASDDVDVEDGDENAVEYNKAEAVLAAGESLKGGDTTLDMLVEYLAYLLGKTDAKPTAATAEKLNSELDAEVLRLGGDLEDYSILHNTGRAEAVKLYNEFAKRKPEELVGVTDLIDLAVAGLEKQVKINKEHGPISDYLEAVSNLEVSESLTESVLANAFKVEFPTAKPVKIKASEPGDFGSEKAPKFEKNKDAENILNKATDAQKVVKK